MNRGALSACLIACAGLITPVSPARAQDAGPVLIKELVTREYSVHVGGVQTPELKELVSREASLFVENGPANAFSQVISREVTLGVVSAAAPPPITDLSMDVSPTGETVTLDWSGYNQWALGDVARFDIYLSDEGPISDVTGLTPVATVGGGATSITLTGLSAYRDHYIAVVPVDLLGNADPAVNYSAAYILAPEAISREVALYVGGEPTPPYRQVVSREASLVVVSAAAPPPIADLDVSTSPTGDSATLDWSGYNPWAVGDIDHFAIYQSDDGPIFDLADATLIRRVSGEALGATIDGLTPFTEHYFAVVPVDGQGRFDPAVHYGAGYVLSPEVISREVSLYVGGEPLSPYAQSISREVSLLVPDAAVPAPVTGIDSGFTVETATDAFGAVDMDWTSYNEIAQQDVLRYRIYVGPAFFTDVTGLTPFATVPAGTQRHTLTGLQGGAILHFAVVAEDALGHFSKTVRSFSAKASVSGVGEVQALSVVSAADSLTFTWQAPAEAGDFLAGYRLYFSGAVDPVVLPKTATSWQPTGLNAAAGYSLRVATVDLFGNESDGTSMIAATWLPNPTGLAMTGGGPSIVLSWTPAEPSALVKHYAIYRSSVPISDVSTLSPVATRTSTSLTLGGYDEIRSQYFAVAAVNISDGMNPLVASIHAGDFEDRSPPVVEELRFGTQVITNGATLTRPDRLTARVRDPAGVSLVEFNVDGVPLASVTSATDQYATDWNIAAISDGQHTLAITSHDGYGNSGTLSYAVAIALAPPPPPRIIRPEDGALLNRVQQTLIGTASDDAEGVLIYLNGAQSVGPLTVTGGSFYTGIELRPGANSLQAAATNRGGTGVRSEPITVTVDTTLPDAPSGLAAQAREAGQVRLAWTGSSNAQVAGYRVYRAATPFAEPGAATRLNDQPLPQTFYDDLPATDGLYYYRVEAVDTAGNASTPSNQAMATADSVPPRATAIDYDPVDAPISGGGAFGQGEIAVTLAVSEPLLTTPFLSIAPVGAAPLAVGLARVDDTSYRGSFQVTERLPSGTAYALFSARDPAGNRGSEIDQGATLELDTAGPVATAFSVVPGDPIRNDNDTPTTVAVGFQLSEPVQAGTEPQLSYSLSASPGTTYPVALSLVGDSWSGSFVLPANAGLPKPESLAFAFSATDALGNAGTRIDGRTGYQVYQGELPPPAVPPGLTASALPGGAVRLAWGAVDEADGYQLYRAAEGVTDLPALVRSAGALEWTDRPPVDGRYRYAVASVRNANGQEGVSAPSDPVEVKADSLAPGAPTGLTLALQGTGVRAVWQAPADEDPLIYALYRVPGFVLDSIEGLTPVLAEIAETQTLDTLGAALDEPNQSYVVTALDPAGNESPPTAWQTLNTKLFQVATLDLTRADDGHPMLSWTPAGQTPVGYDLYLGEGPARLKLNAAPLGDMQYQDLGFTRGERLYTVVALDAQGQASLGRSLRLPALSATPAAGNRLKRGIMNRLGYSLSNDGPTAAAGVVLQLDVAGRSHRSEPIDLPAGESRPASIVAGGYADLPDYGPLALTLEQTPNPGERVRILRNGDIEVTDGTLGLDLLAQGMTRGGAGKVRLRLENTGDVAVQIVTATRRGAAPSDEIRFRLLDADGNDFGGVNLAQSAGRLLTMLPDGRTVAEIPAGEVFESDWMDLPIPAAAPDQSRLALEIDRFHYRLGQADAVSIQGLGTSRSVVLVDTPYLGELTEIAPEHSYGDVPVTITGQALDRVTGGPVPEVPLYLVVENSGLERTFLVTTDATGAFSHAYQPQWGESGDYRVSIIHPDLLERPEQGRFSVGRVFIDRTRATLRMPVDHRTELSFEVRAGKGYPATGVELLYLAEDQPTGTLEPGFVIDPGPALDLAPEGWAGILVGFVADAQANETGTLVLRLTSAEAGGEALALVSIDYALSAAEPALFFSPSYLELGAAPGQRAAGSLTLANQGLAPMEDVRLELLLADSGQPVDWAVLTTPAIIGDLAIGAEAPVELVVAPHEGVPEGIQELVLRVTAANHATRDIPVYAYLTRSGAGGVLFHVSDLYTATPDANGELIPGVAGASIEIQNEAVPTLDYSYREVTDAQGERLFADLPAGSYRYRVSAPDHNDLFGRLDVQPGVTLSQEVFLAYDLITVEWSVNEIPLEDRYEIVLEATYETDVPGAVVVLEPASISLPEMAPGQVLQGELKLTNYGLIRADDLTMSFPEDDAYFDYEFFREIPISLEAKERVTIPYRMVALRPLGGSQSGRDSGGAPKDECGCYTNCVGANACFICRAGDESCTSTRSCWSKCWGKCSGSGAGGLMGALSGGSGSGGGIFQPLGPSRGRAVAAGNARSASCRTVRGRRSWRLR